MTERRPTRVYAAILGGVTLCAVCTASRLKATRLFRAANKGHVTVAYMASYGSVWEAARPPPGTEAIFAEPDTVWQTSSINTNDWRKVWPVATETES